MATLAFNLNATKTQTLKWERAVVQRTVQIYSKRNQKLLFTDCWKLKNKKYKGIAAICRNTWNPGTNTWICDCYFGLALLDIWRRKNRKKSKPARENWIAMPSNSMDKLNTINNSQRLDCKPWYTTSTRSPGRHGSFLD